MTDCFTLVQRRIALDAHSWFGAVASPLETPVSHVAPADPEVAADAVKVVDRCCPELEVLLAHIGCRREDGDTDANRHTAAVAAAERPTAEPLVARARLLLRCLAQQWPRMAGAVAVVDETQMDDRRCAARLQASGARASRRADGSPRQRPRAVAQPAV